MNSGRHVEALKKLEDAQREAGHSPSTRKQYAHWVFRYREARVRKVCRDLQGYLTRLSTVERLNPKTVRQALNALKFYHENATALLEMGENIRTLQEHLGHTHVETTEIYTHANGSGGEVSPLDRAPIAAVADWNVISMRRMA